MDEIKIIKTDEQVEVNKLVCKLAFLVEGKSINEKLIEDLKKSNILVMSCTNKVKQFKQLVFEDNVSVHETLIRIIDTTLEPALVNLTIQDFLLFFTDNESFNVIKEPYAMVTPRDAIILMNCSKDTEFQEILNFKNKFSDNLSGKILWGAVIDEYTTKADKIIILGKEEDYDLTEIYGMMEDNWCNAIHGGFKK